jgi:acylglycerol kinase
LFNSFSDEPTWTCKATITYTDPCSGCKNCYDAHYSAATKAQSKRWWSKFLPTFQLGVAAHGKDFSKVTNDQCAKQTQQHVSPSEILVLTDNIESSNKVDAAIPTLHVKFGKEDYYGFDFMRESWSRLDHPNQMVTDQVLKVRTIDIIPDVVERPILSENEAATESEEQAAKEVFYSIDNEAYEVKPIRISLMPQAVPMYIM